MDRRSTHWCHPGDVLHADLFWMLLTFPSVEGSTHLRVRGKSVGVYGWERGKVYQELDCFMFVRVNLDKPCSLKFKAESMWSFIVLWVIINGKIKSLWHRRNWACLLWISSRCPFRTNAFTTSIKILWLYFHFKNLWSYHCNWNKSMWKGKRRSEGDDERLRFRENGIIDIILPWAEQKEKHGLCLSVHNRHLIYHLIAAASREIKW